jgi:hypothetical protein
MGDSRITDHSHEHDSGDRKTDVTGIPGVNIVQGSGNQPDKLATTPAGRERLIEELQHPGRDDA